MAELGKSELEYLRSADQSLRTIKVVSIWFLVLSIVGLILGLIQFLDKI